MAAHERPNPPRGLLVLGVGNPGRRDDGIGPALVDALEADAVPGLSLEAAWQLSLEHAATIVEHRTVMFVDAAAQGGEPFSLCPVGPGRGTAAFTTHVMDPQDVLAVCGLAFGRVPEAWLLAVRGYDFELGEGLSDVARGNFASALRAAREFVASALKGADGSPADRGFEEEE